jgi:NAD(P)-dependent dehydrogenase (short-subunit alcohol dehydrogenase family)
VGISAYQSAKFAVEGFSEPLSNEADPLGIRVTIVEPGGFRTDSSMVPVDGAPPREERAVHSLDRKCSETDQHNDTHGRSLF